MENNLIILQEQALKMRIEFGLDVAAQPKYPYDFEKWRRHSIESKFCFYCQTKMLFNTYRDNKAMPNKAATVDHIYFKGDIRRAINKKTVSCCRECNMNKNEKDTQLLHEGYEDIEFIKAGLFQIIKLNYNGKFEIDLKQASYNLKRYNKTREKIKNLKKINQSLQSFK